MEAEPKMEQTSDSTSIIAHQPTSRPPSQPSSRSTLRPSSPQGSREPPAPAAGSCPAKKCKKKSSKSAKPANLRRNIRKLLTDFQLKPGTKAAQQEELERRKQLELLRNDNPLPVATHTPQPLEPSHTVVDVPPLPHATKQEAKCLDRSGEKQDSKEPDALPKLPPINDVIEESRGLHTNDALNQPDALGRVLVNINHPADEEDLFLPPQLARFVKPHQIGGIRFLYDNLVESLERYKRNSGFGCILAHSMGLGKTLQAISFIDILLRYTGAKTVLVIVPVNTLQNWIAEFNQWLPAPESLPPDTDLTQVSPRTFQVHILNDRHKSMVARAKVVNDWTAEGGVLLMGYEMYRLLSLKTSLVMSNKRKLKKPTRLVISDIEKDSRQLELLKGIERAISRPGPDVVICDEGHRIKNCNASTSQALKSIRSHRRVVLTGYPLQNNLIEYWCMVDFVRPGFLGTKQEFCNLFERPILNGQCIDSTSQDVRLMRYRSHVLHSLLEGFVQRRGHDVLQTHLPSKEEHVILVRLSPLQRALYKEFMNSGWQGINPIKAFCICCKIWNHPDVLYEVLQKANLANEQDIDIDDLNSTVESLRPSSPRLENKTSDLANSADAMTTPTFTPLQERTNQIITYEWAKDIMSHYHTGILENSAKMILLFHLIDESVKRGDKILVFSQSLSTLTIIENFMCQRPMPITVGNQNQKQNWVRNINYYRLDGSTSASERERLINQFNDSKNTTAWVFLLSTRAGSLGVNLIGANRVVVFDASWNPCHDAQAVCRVYRYGQRKPCYIYRLVCDFTLEKKIYDRQVSKQGMSDRVVDDLNPALNFTHQEVDSLLHFVEEPKSNQSQLLLHGNMETIIRQACLKYPHLITKPPFQHESLLMDRKDMKLTKAEKKVAKKIYEHEKRVSHHQSYNHHNSTSNHRLSKIVRPGELTSIPMMPCKTSICGLNSNPVSPIKYLRRSGAYAQRVVAASDFVIPGTESSMGIHVTIRAGESFHIIQGSKGTYIRTNNGRIVGVHSDKKRDNGLAMHTHKGCSVLQSQRMQESLDQHGIDVNGGPGMMVGSQWPEQELVASKTTSSYLEFPQSYDFPMQSMGIHPVPLGVQCHLTPPIHSYAIELDSTRNNLFHSGISEHSDLAQPTFQDHVQVLNNGQTNSSVNGVGSGSTLDLQSLKRKLRMDNQGPMPKCLQYGTPVNYLQFSQSSDFPMQPIGIHPALQCAQGMTPLLLAGANRSHFIPTSGQALSTDPHGLSPSSSLMRSPSLLPHPLFNPSMSAMLSSVPVPYSQSLLPDSSRIFSNSSLHRGSALSLAPISNAAMPGYLSTSSLLGERLNQPEGQGPAFT